jgi:hypothetical protein
MVEIDDEITVILVTGKLLYDITFPDTACPFYQQGTLTLGRQLPIY